MHASQYIKQQFIDYFKKKHHYHHKHSPLAPSEYDTTMFTIAGMKQFTDFFLGKRTSEYSRICSVQPCLRVNDIDNVGYTKRHHTFFEMLGNFSFGDYFKEEAIAFAYEFLINILKLDVNYMYFTVYHNDNDSYRIWSEKVGENRVIKIETDDNFWRAGEFGPCGPCTEIYFDTGLGHLQNKDFVKQSMIKGEDRFLEIWNLVFMQYNQDKNGLHELPRKCVDTGMGLERITSVYMRVFDNFKTDLLSPIMEKIITVIHNLTHAKIVADHMKSIVFLIGEGVIPSNEGQGYILRNLIRRANIFYKNLESLTEVTLSCLSDYKEDFLDIDKIKNVIKVEEVSFGIALKNSLEMLDKLDVITPADIFKLHDTYGLPIEVSRQILHDRNISIDWNEVEELKKQHSLTSKKKISINFDRTTKQLDYSINHCDAEILFLASLEDDLLTNAEVKSISNGLFIMATDQSCFYGRGGGQEGDKGIISNNSFTADVIDTIKQKISATSYILLHICKVKHGTLRVNDHIFMQLNQELRNARTRAHSATHIFGEYLIRKYKYKVAGSFVDNDYLRIDLDVHDRSNLKDLADEAIEYTKNAIQQSINSIIQYENFEDLSDDILFGEKFNYGEIVRVVNFPGISKQLCGGTHVKNTSDIGEIVIIKESSIRKGTRRLELLTHNRAKEYMLNDNINQSEAKKTESFVIIETHDLKHGGILIIGEGEHQAKMMKSLSKYQEYNFIILLCYSTHNTKFVLWNCDNDIINQLKQRYELKGGGKDIINLGINSILDKNETIKFIKNFV
jgi:alanyl-tRNA synthetase